MRNLKSLLVLAVACVLALPGCPKKEDPEVKLEICNNSIDDDGDGQLDCDDPDCSAAANCKCNAGEIACGVNCCADGQTCNNATHTCVTGQQCAENETVCGSNCCTAGQTCNPATNSCVTGQQCAANETVCGSNCCTAGQTCNAATNTCEPTVVTCQTGETLCGSDCCTDGTETCVAGSCLAANPGTCTIAASYGTVTLTGQVDNSKAGAMVLSGALPANDATTDLFQLEMYEGSGVFAGGFQSGTFDLTGVDLNYKTCGLCLRVFGDDDPAAGTVGAQYFATGGSMVVGLTDTTLTATLTNGTFVEVTVAEDYTSIPVENGCQSTIARAQLDGTMQPQGAPCSPLTPDCADGQGCYYDSSAHAFTCRAAGTGAVGGACTGLGTCVPGAECMDPGVCRLLCNTTTGVPCTGAATCTDAGGGVGICLTLEDCNTPGDEDGDGLADCADPVCSSLPACLATLCQGAVAAPGATFDTADSATTGTLGIKGSCGGKGRELIYTLSAGNQGETGHLTIAVTSPFDAVIYARSSCDDAATQIGCSDGVNGGSATTPKTETLSIDNYQGGTPITLFVDAYLVDGGGVSNVAVSFVVPLCPNGVVEPGETCDDGNTVAGDGCDANCQIEADETEPNNTFAEADIYGTAPFNAAITAADEDWIKITLPQVSALTAEVLDMGNGACAANQLDSKLELYASDGTTLEDSDDDSGAGYCSLLSIGSLAPGDYFVRIRGYNDTAAFPYVLRVTLGAP